MTRVKVQIDHILTDEPGLEQPALEAALRQEVSALIATHGPQALGTSVTRPRVTSEMTDGKASLATRVAQSTIGAVKP